MKALLVFTICFAVVAVPSGLHAVLIQHNGTNVFEEDFEEAYGAGFDDPRDPIPWIGRWRISGAATNIQVLQEAYQPGDTRLPAGGADEGNEYLKITKPSGHSEPSAGGFDVSDGALHIEYMCYIPVTGGWNPGGGVAAFVLADSFSIGGTSGNCFWINANRPNTLLHYRGPSWTWGSNIVEKGTSTPMTWEANKWQKWEFDYTYVAGDEDTVVLTLDGVESEPMVPYYDDKSARWLVFRPNGSLPSNVLHLDATTPENKPRLIGHYDFEESGGGPWSQVTDKVGPVFHSHAWDVGGGNVNLTSFNGGYGLTIDSNANNAVDLGQGLGNEFDVDYSEGLSVEAIVTFTNEYPAGYVVSKRGVSTSVSAWYLYYFGPSGNAGLSNHFGFAVCSGSSLYNRIGYYKIDASNRDHRWQIRGDYVPAADQIKVSMVDLDTGDMFQDVSGTVPLTINRVSNPMVLGAGRADYYQPFPGTIDSIRIYGEGDPPIPKVGTVISVR